MRTRGATPDDWPAIWGFMSRIVAAGETFSSDRDMDEATALGVHVLEQARADGYRAMVFNAVVETNTPAVTLWRDLGFEVIATIPEGFEHPTHGFVGLHVMHRRL